MRLAIIITFTSHNTGATASMKLNEHCIPTCIATTEIIPHDLMLKALIHNKRVAMKYSSERKLNLLIRSLLKRDRAKRCDGQNDIFVISVIDLESSSSNDLKQALMAPHCYLPIKDQSCVVVNEATNASGDQPACERQPNSSVVMDEVSLCDDILESRDRESSIDQDTDDHLDFGKFQDHEREQEWSSSSVDSLFCRCNLSNIDTVFPEENAAIQLGEKSF